MGVTIFSSEKTIIRLNKFFRNLIFHWLFWEFNFLFYVFLTAEHELFISYFNLLNAESVYLIVSILAFSISVLFTFLDILFNDRILRIFPIYFMIFLKSVFYFASVYLLIYLASPRAISTEAIESYTDLLEDLPQIDIVFMRFLVYFYLACFLNSFFKGMLKKVGRGNIKSWVFGLLNKPREEMRIFMFIDMKSSTTIAETLMHKKFSHLVQDVFNDLSIVDNYQGEIYQYLGDGAIISWNIKDGLNRDNFLNAFYAFTNLIVKRDRYYQRKYGISPKFKAGAHAGKVMVLQVGQVRRDISYNGDTMNTAARIESLCNEYKQNFMISGDLYEILKVTSAYNFKNLGNVKLKGKKKATEIYQVKY